MFSVLTLLAVLLVWIFQAKGDTAGNSGLIEISDGWKDDMGQIRSIEDVHTNADGTPVTLEKKLMAGYENAGCLCFSSSNVNLWVYLDGRQIYSFESSENITGKGYGTAFHEVDLEKDLGGRILRIVFEASDPTSGTIHGYISNVYMGSAMAYTHMLFDKKAALFGVSIFILLFGVILVLIDLAVRKSERAPFDVASLGVAAIILGAWFIISTDIIQLFAGHIYQLRVLNRMLIFLSGYPLVRFLNSVTNRKRIIYPLIQLMSTVLCLLILIVTRYEMGIDMMSSVLYVLCGHFTLLGALCVAMYIDDRMSCVAAGLPSRFKGYFLGLIIFLACIFADLGLYLARKIVGNDVYGVATRGGTLLLTVIALRTFIKWWTRDRAIIERGRLISKTLSVAGADDTPDQRIRQILECISGQFGAKSVSVFEDQHNGKFHGSYVWYDPSAAARPSVVMYLQQRGVVDEILRSYEAGGNRFVIDDTESYRSVNANIYSILRNQNIKNVVISPIGENERNVGLLVITDLPAEIIEEAAENAPLMAYYLYELIRERDEEKRTRIFMYNDPLSGALNRKAFNEFTSEDLDKSSSFGLAIVEIRDLEAVSSQKGYEVGDKLVTDTVNIMSDIFGKDCVYRLVGSRFAAFGFETDEAYFEDDIERLLKEANDKGIALLVGRAFCNNGINDINTAVKYALSNMC